MSSEDKVNKEEFFRDKNSIMSELAYDYWSIEKSAYDKLVNGLLAGKAFDSSVIYIEGARQTFIDGAEYVGQSLYASKKGNTGFLEIFGPLVPYSTWLESYGDVVAVESLTRDLKALQEDPEVEQIVLVVDSPGGVVDGISEFAEMVGASEKPIAAYVVGDAASAAYWIVSRAKKIVASPSSREGSIGVVTTLADYTEFYKQKGIEVRELINTQSPRKRTDITTEEGRGDIQAVLDGIADVFINSVATGRGVTPEQVQETFGQGAVLVAAESLERGLIDAIEKTKTFEQGFKNTGIEINQIKGEKKKMAVENQGVVNGISDAEKQAAIDAERNKLKTIEGVKKEFDGSHPEVVKAVAAFVDDKKFESGSTIASVRAGASKLAFDKQKEIIADMEAAAKAVGEDGLEAPSTGDKKQAKKEGDKRTGDERKQMLASMKAGIESYKKG